MMRLETLQRVRSVSSGARFPAPAKMETTMASNGVNGKRKSRRWFWVTVILAVLVTGGVAASFAFRSNPSIDPAKLSVVETGDLARSVVATGKIEPLTKVEVKSKASGIGKETVCGSYGEWVKQGQLMAELDKEELNARMREAKAALMAAHAGRQSAEATLQRNPGRGEEPRNPVPQEQRGPLEGNCPSRS
ncbi:MAG: hypothetical protein U5J83_02800 [Bryobacterales bacterium]|nr:hypothetical protein [Bryobacterales bacterium]